MTSSADTSYSSEDLGLKTVDDMFSDEQHRELDGLVNASRSSPFDNPPILLSLVCKYSEGKLRNELEDYKSAAEFCLKYKKVSEVLQQALKGTEYKKIRILKILYPPESPTTPEQQFHEVNGNPRQPLCDTQSKVESFLQQFNAKLKAYLAGPPCEFWKADLADDPRSAQFVNDLKLPKIGEFPSLLLHDLSNGIINDKFAAELLLGQNKMLINTSGSGKTRVLFECFAKTWGFYFTVFGENQQLTQPGSKDLTTIISDKIPITTGFKLNPAPESPIEVFKRNDKIAERRIHQILKARVLILRRFWETIRNSGSDPQDFKLHWLYLQLQPIKILGIDIFEDLANNTLNKASDDYLVGNKSGWLGEELHEICSSFDRNRFLIALDEAQVLSLALPRAFQSVLQPETRRSVLRPLIQTIGNSAKSTIIVSGTGLSYSDISEVTKSIVAKPNISEFHVETGTGAFDRKASQVDYIRRYLPEHILSSTSGTELVERAWRWCRGRHRFTASLLEVLIQTLFKSPHRALNFFVWSMSHFTPTDGGDLVVAEEDIPVPRIHSSLSFRKILKDPRYVGIFSEVLADWIMHREYHPVDDEMWNLVQFGFARFSTCEGNFETKLTIDEPLVLLAVAAEMQNGKSQSLGAILQQRLSNSSGRGESYEDLIAFYLASVFIGRTSLSDVFHFTKIPKWAKERAELVSISWDGLVAIPVPFNLAEMRGDALCVGKKCSTVNETLDWFENPSSVMCFPDQFMGPDLVLFIRLESGLILTVAVQCKCTVSLSNDVVEKAVTSLDEKTFYGLKESRRKPILDIVWGLNRAKLPRSFSPWIGSLPILKVIASFPAVTGDDLPKKCVSLKMEHCLAISGEKNLLRNVAEHILGRAWNPAPPSKRRRVEPKKEQGGSKRGGPKRGRNEWTNLRSTFL